MEKCQAGDWPRITGQWSGDCPNEAAISECWFDEEGLDVELCAAHEEDERPVDIQASASPEPQV